MSSSACRSNYPAPLFLHCRLAIPGVLQDVLQSSVTPKLYKASLMTYVKSSGPHDSAVSYDGRNYGAWGGDDEVKGRVYMVANQAEEDKILNYVGGGCILKDEEFEVVWSGLFGRKKTVWGKVVVQKPSEDIVERQLPEGIFSISRLAPTPNTPPEYEEEVLKYLSGDRDTPPKFEPVNIVYGSPPPKKHKRLVQHMKALHLFQSTTAKSTE